MTTVEKERIIEQVIAIRDSGKTNMFDITTVQRLAFDEGFYELVMFIQENHKGYGKLILTGDFE